MATKKKPAAKTTTATKATKGTGNEEATSAPSVPKELQFEPRAAEEAELSKKQVQQLYEKLLAERARVLHGHDEHLNDAISDIDPLSDEMDIAQRHMEQAYLMRFADKERKLLGQISIALEKLKEGDYGVCEGTGEAISYKRLELRPWTRYSVEYKEIMEREKKQHLR